MHVRMDVLGMVSELTMSPATEPKINVRAEGLTLAAALSRMERDLNFHMEKAMGERKETPVSVPFYDYMSLIQGDMLRDQELARKLSSLYHEWTASVGAIAPFVVTRPAPVLMYIITKFIEAARNSQE